MRASELMDCFIPVVVLEDQLTTFLSELKAVSDEVGLESTGEMLSKTIAELSEAQESKGFITKKQLHWILDADISELGKLKAKLIDLLEHVDAFFSRISIEGMQDILARPLYVSIIMFFADIQGQSCELEIAFKRFIDSIACINKDGYLDLKPFVLNNTFPPKKGQCSFLGGDELIPRYCNLLSQYSSKNLSLLVGLMNQIYEEHEDVNGLKGKVLIDLVLAGETLLRERKAAQAATISSDAPLSSAELGKIKRPGAITVHDDEDHPSKKINTTAYYLAVSMWVMGIGTAGAILGGVAGAATGFVAGAATGGVIGLAGAGIGAAPGAILGGTAGAITSGAAGALSGFALFSAAAIHARNKGAGYLVNASSKVANGLSQSSLYISQKIPKLPTSLLGVGAKPK